MAEPIRRREPAADFDWDASQRADERARARKKKKKKAPPAASTAVPPHPPDAELPAEPDPEVLAEMERLTDEERALPYPPYFVADWNLMRRRLGQDPSSGSDT